MTSQGAAVLADGAAPGTLAALLFAQVQVPGASRVANITLVPGFGDDALFSVLSQFNTVIPEDFNTFNLVSNFTAHFIAKASYAIETSTDFGFPDFQGNPQLVLQTFTIAVSPSVITTSTTSTLARQPVTVRAKVATLAPYEGTPYGIVTFSVGGVVQRSVPVDANGLAFFTTPPINGTNSSQNTVTAAYNDPQVFTTVLTPIAATGTNVPVTIVLGEGAADTGAGTIKDGTPAGRLAGTVQTNDPLIGQYHPATDTLMPGLGDDDLFTLAPDPTANGEVYDLVTNFQASFARKQVYTVTLTSDIGVMGLNPATQVFTFFVVPTPGSGGGIAHPGSTLAVFDPTGISNALSAVWYLGSANSANAPPTVVPYGGNNWRGVLGDWTGKGFDSLGVVDTTGTSSPAGAVWYLRNSNTAGGPDVSPFVYGLPAWTPLVGDWNGDGSTTVGAFDPASATWLGLTQPAGVA